MKLQCAKYLSLTVLVFDSSSLANGGELCVSSPAMQGLFKMRSNAFTLSCFVKIMNYVFSLGYKLITGVLITHKNLMSGMAGQCQKIRNLG